MARLAKAAQSSSGEKQKAIAAPAATDEAGNTGERVAKARERAAANTHRLCRYRLILGYRRGCNRPEVTVKQSQTSATGAADASATACDQPRRRAGTAPAHPGNGPRDRPAWFL